MWKLIDVSDDKFIFKELDGETVFEYCSIFKDENDVKCYVPDSMYQEFINKYQVQL